MKALTMCAVAMLAVGCGAVTPDAGTEAVLVRKPMFFGHGGIDGTPIKPGRSYVAWTTQAQYVNMQPQRIDANFDDMMTKSGVPVDFHSVITVRVTDSVKLVEKFGNDTVTYTDSTSVPGFWARNLDQPFRTAVRDEVKKHEMNAIAIDTTATALVDEAVTAHLKNIVTETGVPVEIIDVSIGRVNPPDAVKNQRIATAEQEQRKLTEDQRKLAEDARKMAEESKAAADSAYNVKMNANGGQNLTPDQYLRYLDIQMKRDACTRGNCTFLIGTNAQPIVQAGQ
jgi:regulator of protease activity HflC (stomatin/prohibitin superfamily)